MGGDGASVEQLRVRGEERAGAHGGYEARREREDLERAHHVERLHAGVGEERDGADGHGTIVRGTADGVKDT